MERDSNIAPQGLTEFHKLVEDLSAKIENLLFVIWIQDQRHDYWMKFIKEVKEAMQKLREEIEDGNKLFNGQRGCRIPSIGNDHDLPTGREEGPTRI